MVIIVIRIDKQGILIHVSGFAPGRAYALDTAVQDILSVGLVIIVEFRASIPKDAVPDLDRCRPHGHVNSRTEGGLVVGQGAIDDRDLVIDTDPTPVQGSVAEDETVEESRLVGVDIDSTALFAGRVPASRSGMPHGALGCLRYIRRPASTRPLDSGLVETLFGNYAVYG